jgi:hypothetical protein
MTSTGVATSGSRRSALEGRPATAGNLLDEAKDALSGVAGSASEAVREVYDRGRQYAREAADQYPEAERYYREGTQAVRKQAAQNPLLTMLVGACFGYAIAWLIHSSSAEDRRVPASARNRQRYVPDER